MKTLRNIFTLLGLVAATTLGAVAVRLWTPSPVRTYALGYAHLAVIPPEARVTRESQDGWHFETLEFQASPEVVQAWIVASPALRSRQATVETSGERTYPCDPPHGVDPDTPEGDCTHVRLSTDGQGVAIHLLIPPSAY